MEPKNNLSATQICQIIKTCHTNDVATFEFQGMHMTFHPRRNGDAAQPSQASDHTPTLQEQLQPVVSELTEADKDEMVLMDQEAIHDAEEAQMLIDNSKGFENFQIARHIERTRLNNEKTQS